ncbi:MAG: mucoidy inhibitor MuiA family protein, partial [Bacteroidetes bacterium]|nr:mucoidy inhibitor MuiA family protein [Bacteroidota bacterium]
MKNPLLILLSFCFSLTGLASEKEIKIKSSPKEVTVFLRGAEVMHQGSATIPAGTSEVIFENLSPMINRSNIQAKGEGDFTILGVQFRTNYLNQQPKSREIILLEDSLEDLQFKSESLKNQKSIYESEESFLLSNKNIGGANTGVNAADLERIAGILRTRLTELKGKQLEIKKTEKKLQEQIVRIRNQLASLNSERDRSTGEVIVSVHAKNTVNAKLTITYLVPNAGWTPQYDLRAVDAQSPVQLNYKANVFQNTGEDWKNIKISLSTGNPSLGGVPPVIMPIVLSFEPPYTYRKHEDQPEAMMDQEAMMDKKALSINNKPASSSDDFTVMQENTTSFKYDISIPYTFISGAKAQA